MDDNIKQFFSSQEYAVISASTNRSKFGNKVLRCYQQNNKIIHPVNPKEKIIEGVPCITKLSDLPGAVMSISIVTPPKVTENIVEQAIEHGIKNIWMQPGSESALAIQLCRDNNINIIANGPCILVELGFVDEVYRLIFDFYSLFSFSLLFEMPGIRRNYAYLFKRYINEWVVD